MDKPTVTLSPTKRFFVEMLTRDIELEDAILDLLDNCVDGGLRLRGYDPTVERPYEGLWARLEFSSERFSITDNCGGIPQSIRASAFRLGRLPSVSLDQTLPTVGTYGIGMKRAIFKLGRECVIRSEAKDSGFEVTMDEEWFATEDLWELPVSDLPGASAPGTTITVTKLLPDVAAAFSGPTSFAERFRSRVSQYYSILIEKGFEVRIDEGAVVPLPITFKVDDFAELGSAGFGIAPYIYEGKVEGVDVEVIVGFYSPFSIDPDEEPVKGKAEEAGWTIVCNDRVVVYKDKTILTGWGDGGPSYHPQFRQIAGVVVFSSKDPSLLPITTTKRGIDAQKATYLEVRKKMRQGLFKFTSYTNKLKTVSEPEREELFRNISNVDLRALRSVRLREAPIQWKAEKGGQGKTFDVPLPPLKESKDKKMVFTRSIDKIRRVARFLFDDPDVGPSDVAAGAFDQTYERAKSKK